MSVKEIDLDLTNYSLTDLYKLFHINNNNIDLIELKNAKKMVLKMHPDKSKLDSKYFLFFSKAYKKLYSIYEFQNKNLNKKEDNMDYFKDDKKESLSLLFEKNKEFKDAKVFNNWFNEQFEKHKINNENNGYGDWLKGDEGLYSTDSINMSSMHEEFEKKKKNIQSLINYEGVNESFASTLGGSLLGDSFDKNFSSGLYDNNLSFQDVRQAHIETIIPITQDDYKNRPLFKNEQEYKLFRDRQDINPMKEEEAIKKLKYNNNKINEESANLAYFYAKQSEEVNKKSNDFWGGIQLLL
jgi:hypothetical protein